MNVCLHLAWRYLLYHRGKTVLMTLALALVLALPLSVRLLVSTSAIHLNSRAEQTPLLVGSSGSPLELVLSSLYFDSVEVPVLEHREWTRIREMDLGRAVPLHVRFRAGNHPVAGTTLEYFQVRGLSVRDGHMIQRLGDCVVGSAVAGKLGIQPGDTLLSDPENVFDLAGTYPLKMNVTGVLAPTGTPDDGAVFCDLKTAWIMEGLAHGHDDLESSPDSSAVLDRTESSVTANASVRSFQQVTDENIGSFHFHGNTADFPITAVLVWPVDRKTDALLRGRYLDSGGPVQMLVPMEVVGQLLERVFSVQQFIQAGFVLLGAAVIGLLVLVTLLSARLRFREMDTLFKMGASRRLTAGLYAMELGMVLLASFTIALILLLVLNQFGTTFYRLFT